LRKLEKLKPVSAEPAAAQPSMLGSTTTTGIALIKASAAPLPSLDYPSTDTTS